MPDLDPDHAAELEDNARAPLHAERGEDPYAIRAELENLMWDRVGLVRDAVGLRSALEQIAALRERARAIGVGGSSRHNLAWAEALDVRNLLEVATLTARSALERTESRGAHYRSDFPSSDDVRWLANVYARDALVWTEPVRLTREAVGA
jgi:succinate dehydrogenase/fumarate reductase flavoprotein subunit